MALESSTRTGGRPSTIGRLRRFALARPVVTVFLVAFAVRAVAAIVIWQTRGGVLFFDDGNYHAISVDWAKGRLGDRDPFDPFFFSENWGYLLPISIAKRVFGSSPLSGQLLVAVAGAGVAALVAALAHRCLRVGAALAAGLFVALLPSQVMWSSITLKDPFVATLAAAVAMLVVIELSSRRWRHAAIVVALVGVLCVLEAVRIHSFAIACWALVIAAVLAPSPQRLARIAGATAIALLLPAALGHGLGAIDALSQKSLTERRVLNAQSAETAVVRPVFHPEDATENADHAETAAADAAAAAAAAQQAAADLRALAAAAAAETDESDTTTPADAEAREAAAAAAAEAAADAEREAAAAATAAQEAAEKAAAAQEDIVAAQDSVEKNLAYLPKGVALMILQPFLWDLTPNGSVRAAAMEHLLWYPIVALALLGLGKAWRHRRVFAFPVAFGAGAVIATALSEGNFGTAFRHRTDFVWVVALLAGGGVSWLGDLRSRRRADDVVAAPDGGEADADRSFEPAGLPG
jgi:hypothetical protein